MDRAHEKDIGDICKNDVDWVDNLTYAHGATYVAEREPAATAAVDHPAGSEHICDQAQRRENAAFSSFLLQPVAHHVRGASPR